MAKYTSKLQNKRVLVLGGTSGIGFCVAEAAIEHGAIVTIASSRQAKIDKTIERITKDYPNARISGTPCDLSDPATCEDNIKALYEFATKDGKLDHVVNTAGDPLHVPKLNEVTAENYVARQQVRNVGSIILAKHAMNYMHVSNASSITFTGGVNTHKPTPGWSITAASGGTGEGLIRGLAVDMKPIRANLVAPGAILTELWTDSFTEPGQLEKVKEMFASKLLTGELGTPEDTAEAYIYMMKDKFVDGQTLLTEGGFMLM